MKRIPRARDWSLSYNPLTDLLRWASTAGRERNTDRQSANTGTVTVLVIVAASESRTDKLRSAPHPPTDRLTQVSRSVIPFVVSIVLLFWVVPPGSRL